MVKKLMDVDGTSYSFRTALTNSLYFLRKMVSEEEFEAFIEEILSEVDIAQRMKPIYAEYYDAEDILNFIAFFKTGTGKRFLKFQSKLLPKVSIGCQLVATELLVVALKKAQDKYGERDLPKDPPF